jgi:hypothetical protein
MSVFVKTPPLIPILFLYSSFIVIFFLPVSFKIGGYVSLHDSNFNVEGESTKISSDTKSNSFFLKVLKM